jgi:hypothetical protein
MDISPLHVWAIVRLLPNMQRTVINRFRRRGDAENYLRLLRQYTHDTNLTIVFDPPSSAVSLEAHSKNCEKSGTLSSSSRIASND